MTAVKLDIVDGHFLEVFIWPSRRAMYEGMNDGNDYEARYISNGYTINTLDGKKQIGPKIGEIHLALNGFGAGVFAHEFQHFILDYINMREFDFADGDNEMICWIVGNMTADFWAQFYDLYSDQEPNHPANEARKWREAYENMRQFAEDSGLDTVTVG